MGITHVFFKYLQILGLFYFKGKESCYSILAHIYFHLLKYVYYNSIFLRFQIYIDPKICVQIFFIVINYLLADVYLGATI